jgi:hypothetical protein
MPWIPGASFSLILNCESSQVPRSNLAAEEAVSGTRDGCRCLFSTRGGFSTHPASTPHTPPVALAFAQASRGRCLFFPHEATPHHQVLAHTCSPIGPQQLRVFFSATQRSQHFFKRTRTSTGPQCRLCVSSPPLQMNSSRQDPWPLGLLFRTGMKTSHSPFSHRSQRRPGANHSVTSASHEVSAQINNGR